MEHVIQINPVRIAGQHPPTRHDIPPSHAIKWSVLVPLISWFYGKKSDGLTKTDPGMEGNKKSLKPNDFKDSRANW
jgi:hypothetical protein